MSEARIRPISEADIDAFIELRLEALRDHPEAFGSSYEDCVKYAPATWRSRIDPAIAGDISRIFVVDIGGKLMGIAGVMLEEGSKTNHSAFIWSVYVRPAARGQRLADRLIEACVGWCEERRLRIVRLTAATSNAAAIRCYARQGFHVCGVQPEVIRVGETYYDELLMCKRV